MIIDSYLYQSGMTKEDADKQIAILRKVTSDLIAEGPEACRAFLIRAGIIKKKKGGMNKIAGCRLRIKRCRWSICNYIEGINRADTPFWQRKDGAYAMLVDKRKELESLYDELDKLTGLKNERLNM